MSTIETTLGQDVPPPSFSPAEQALWWIAKSGFDVGPGWERAHEICQSHEGEPLFDRLHGLVHLIEGDTGNAAYWYRRAGSAVPGDLRREWAAIAAGL